MAKQRKTGRLIVRDTEENIGLVQNFARSKGVSVSGLVRESVLQTIASDDKSFSRCPTCGGHREPVRYLGNSTVVPGREYILHVCTHRHCSNERYDCNIKTINTRSNG